MGSAIELAQHASDPTTTAGLIALAIATMEVAKAAVVWAGRKISKKEHSQTLVVQLDPEVSRIIHETGQEVKEVTAVISRVDADGTPLVYSDRAVPVNIERTAEILNKVEQAQTRLAETLDVLEKRFAEHDKTDAVTFARIGDSQLRLEQTVAQSHDNIIELKRDHADTLKKIDHIIELVAAVK